MQSFSIINPIPLLAPYIRYYWILKDDSTLPVSERTLPVGCVQLVFHKGKQLFQSGNGVLQPRSFISGQTLGYSDVVSTGNIEMLVVVFQPWAAKSFLHIPANLFNGQNISIDEIGDPDLSILSRRIGDTADNNLCILCIEQFLVRRLYSFPDYNIKRLTSVFQEINNRPQISISQLSEVACLSEKQFVRIFLGHTGMTPKDFMRIVRMQRALFVLQNTTGIPFAQLAYTCGFSDQSHMIREFKLFSGYTPGEYLSVCAPHSDYFSNL